jgi:transcriptional regulator with XRE-family HTH domain
MRTDIAPAERASFGTRLRWWRINRGFTRAQLARAAGVAYSRMSGWEELGYVPRAANLAKLAGALRVDPETLLGAARKNGGTP